MKKLILLLVCTLSLLTANAQYEMDSIGSKPYLKFDYPYIRWSFPSFGWFHCYEYDDTHFVYNKDSIQGVDSTIVYNWSINGEEFCNTDNPTFVFIPNSKLNQLSDSITVIYGNEFATICYNDLQLIDTPDTFYIDIQIVSTFNSIPLDTLNRQWFCDAFNTTLGFYQGITPIHFRSVSELNTTNVKQTVLFYDKQYYNLLGNKTNNKGLVIEKNGNVYKKVFIK